VHMPHEAMTVVLNPFIYVFAAADCPIDLLVRVQPVNKYDDFDDDEDMICLRDICFIFCHK